MRGAKIIIMFLLISMSIALLILISFYFWASSGSVPDNDLAEIKVYANSPSPRLKNRFRVMTYNIGYFSGKFNMRPDKAELVFFQNNAARFDVLLKKVRPDFIGIQEIDFGSYRSYFINQLDHIAVHNGFNSGAMSINWDKKYVPFPYWPPSIHFRRILSGQAVLSRFGIEFNRRIVLPPIQNKPFYYRAFYLERLVQMTQMNIKGRRLLIMNVHLEAYESETREKQAEMVLSLYRSVKDLYPVLLVGDFNCVPPWASKKYGFEDEPEMDFRGGNIISRFLQEGSLKEAFLTSGHNYSEADTFTYPAHAPSRKLDYIFYDRRKIRCIKSEVLKIDSSDHLPLLMEFAFTTK